MTSPRHKHTLQTDRTGRDICTVCNQVVTKPILSSDDQRLVDAGFHRSGGNYVEDLQTFPTLPEILIALYHNGPALGLPRAPVAWYIEVVAQEEGRRYRMFGVPDPVPDIWADLYRRWLEHVQRSKS